MIESFTPGIKLSEMFYNDAVKDKLEKNYPDLDHADDEKKHRTI